MTASMRENDAVSVGSQPTIFRWVSKNKAKKGVCTIFIDDVIHKTKHSQPVQKPKPTGCEGFELFHLRSVNSENEL